MRNKETKEKGKQNSCILYVTPYLSRSSFISFENWVVSNNIGRNEYDEFLNYSSSGDRLDHDQVISPTTPTSSDLPNSPVTQITTLPSIPKRSTYRIELQPGETLPECKLAFILSLNKSKYA